MGVRIENWCNECADYCHNCGRKSVEVFYCDECERSVYGEEDLDENGLCEYCREDEEDE